MEIFITLIVAGLFILLGYALAYCVDSCYTKSKKVEFKVIDRGVKCDECKHYLDKWDAQVVPFETESSRGENYYCPTHRRKYDYVKWGWMDCPGITCDLYKRNHGHSAKTFMKKGYDYEVKESGDPIRRK
jgi:hypothetical protein